MIDWEGRGLALQSIGIILSPVWLLPSRLIRLTPRNKGDGTGYEIDGVRKEKERLTATSSIYWLRTD